MALDMTFLNNTHRPSWWPLYLNCTAEHGVWGFLCLPRDLVLNFRFAPDVEERVIWEGLGFTLTRPESLEEYDERMDSYAEQASLEREANRYTEWSY